MQMRWELTLAVTTSELLQKSPGTLNRLWARNYWTAHYDQLAKMTVILEPDEKEGRPNSLILSVGCDYALRVWSQRGRMLGQVFTIFPAPLPPSTETQQQSRPS